MALTEPRVDGRSRPVHDAPSPETEIGALFGELSEEAKLLVRQEVELAKAEIKESTQHATGVGAGFGAAALVGYLALAVLAVAAALGLAEIMPAGFAFLIVGVLLAAVAGIAFLIGRKNLQALNPVPRKTIDTIKEDLSWLRARMS
ncbi:MAG TPA: phage holin family protein [Acidimicrobiales bacterium]|nr:phage holin family protein [Acidimicrobiales bacterium]